MLRIQSHAGFAVEVFDDEHIEGLLLADYFFKRLVENIQFDFINCSRWQAGCGGTDGSRQ